MIAQGKSLLPHFITVANGPIDPAVAAAGNEAVLRARFEDAASFYREQPLQDFRPKLSGTTFQKDLGSLLAKSDRVEKLVPALAAAVTAAAPSQAGRLAAAWASPAVLDLAVQAAHLAKADLSTSTIAEMTALAGEGWRGEVVRPFVSSLTEGRSPAAVLAAVAGAVTGSVSTVAGVLLMTTISVSLYGLFAAVFAPAPALLVAIGAWPGTAAAAAVMDGSAAGLRRLAACGLLLTAVASHALLDFAGSVKQQGGIDVAQAVKRLVVLDKAAPHLSTLKYFLPNPTIYSLLNLGFVAAAALQSYFLYIAPTWGVNVNWDTALWGPLYGTAFLGLVYGLVALTRFDWSSAADAMLRVAYWFAELTMWFWDSFVWKFSWSEKTRRA
ncbi:hypothetical protein HXX76_004182 [Chlamydomonas incerta]|uniref:glycine--tRNA ligase n=1 Tax=Chlamydomonas incerta TaxID=51695 RepID=A0A835W7C2_CHLIN|nr:hypothetical protein HXX76_004182 [Chlamydomonas incerta]|eukprot:KAG2440068.1 hypothetical protein HXX76_004182 [Chlamydomonas incerta]